MNQHEFVRGCHAFYEEEGLVPGDGPGWEKAHYPAPKGVGKRTIWLLHEHHHVQGVLQSLEFDSRCFWPTAKYYLVGPWEFLLPTYYRYNNAKEAREYWASRTPEERSDLGRRLQKAQFAVTTPEQRSATSRKAGAARVRNLKKDPKAYLEYQRVAGTASAEAKRGQTKWINIVTGQKKWSVEKPSEEWESTAEWRERKKKRAREEAKKGSSWWVNQKGENLRQSKCPGEGWRRGRKWELAKPKPWVNEVGDTVISKIWPGEGWRRK